MPEEPLHLFCENTNVGSNNESFGLVLKSGGVVQVFIFTPDHMKQLSKLLLSSVTDWEKLHGTLEGRLPSEPLKSPYGFGEKGNTE